MYKQLRSLKPHDREHNLPESERARMKREFVAFMELHAPTEPENVPSVVTRATAWRWAALVPVLFAAFIGYASERALPQDPLYLVKTAVTEPLLLRGASLSPDTYARAETLIIKRRLREAEQITAAKRHEPESVASLTSAINQRVLSVQKYVAEPQEDDLPARLQIASDLENALDSSTVVLQVVASISDASISDLIHHIELHGSSTSVLGDQLEEALADGAPETTAAYVVILEEAIEDHIETIDERLEKAADDMPDPLLDRAADLREEARTLHSSSTEHGTLGNASESLSALQDALESLEQAEMLISAEEWLDHETP